VSGISNILRFLHTDSADVGCQHALALLHLYAERELDDRDAADHYPGIAAHLADCGACAEDLRGLLALLTTPETFDPDRTPYLQRSPPPTRRRDACT
jgi:hypothetical protein